MPAPPSMCNKFSLSGGVSMAHTLYLRNGKLFQVCFGPVPCVRLALRPACLPSPKFNSSPAPPHNT